MSTPDPDALAAAVDAARRVVVHLRKTQAPASLLEDARAALDAVAEQLAGYDFPGPYAQGALDPSQGFPSAAGRPMEFFPYSPIIGRLNPIAPPVEFEVRDGEVCAEHVFDAPWTGPPTALHGGVIALLFDDLLGAANVLHDVPGFTGTLTVRYRALTPIGRRIQMRGWVERSEGRKTWSRGEIRHGDVLCAEAEGVFIRPAESALHQMRGGGAAQS